jgi:hypothetical protein
VAESINALDVYQNLLKTSTNIQSSIEEAKESAKKEAVEHIRFYG